MNPGFKLIFVIMLTVLGAVDHAIAACQGYRSDPAFLADLAKDDFMGRVFPSAPPQTPEQKQKLKATARGRRPEDIGDLAQLEAFWRQSTGRSFPFPITERVPLEWKLKATHFPPDPVKVEFDPDGDGKPEFVQEARDWGNVLTYTYKKEGNYESVVRIHDRSGKIHTYRTRLRILSAAAFDAELRTVWNEFKNALGRSDRAAAMECIHTQSRNRYRDNFAAIPDFRNKIDGTLGAIEKQQRGAVIYELLPKQGSDVFTYELLFEMDADAAWRISSF